MRVKSTSRVRAHHGVVLGAALLPLMLSTTSAPPVPVHAPSRAVASVDRADLASQPVVSRSASRFDYLGELDGRLPAPGTVEVRSPKGSSTWTASALADHGLPAAAARAYRRAARTLAASDPACRLPWTLLAAVGRVESDHGRYGGSVLGDDGVSRPRIIGVPLNGVGPVAAISDTDGGRLDRDQVWDRAVGPMQFIPSTWSGAARDGDGDGVRTPNDLDDAALAAAAYLCSGSGSVLSDSGMRAAVFRYNPSQEYVALVLAFEAGYRTGVFTMPTLATPEPEHKDRGADRRHEKDSNENDQDRNRPGTKPAGPAQTPAAAPTQHAPSPEPPGTTPKAPADKATDKAGSQPTKSTKPKPTTAPSTPPATPTEDPGPVLLTLNGTLSSCDAGWCVDGKSVNLGPAIHLASPAVYDYDEDKTTESNAAELDGLVGKQVIVEVEVGGGAIVHTINGFDYS